MLRKRSAALRAKEITQTDKSCPFCERKDIGEIIETGAHLLVVENIIPYDVFEGGPVEKHYMVIPKEHRESLSQFTDKERREYVELLAKYELKGFNSYTRAVISKTRSVAHHHTHLLYTPAGRVHAFFFWSKPYILLFRKPKTIKQV